MGKSIVVSSRARFFFSGGYLKMRTCGKVGKLEIVFNWFILTGWVDLSKVCICQK